jgi:hypothetical protein
MGGARGFLSALTQDCPPVLSCWQRVLHSSLALLLLFVVHAEVQSYLADEYRKVNAQDYELWAEVRLCAPARTSPPRCTCCFRQSLIGCCSSLGPGAWVGLHCRCLCRRSVAIGDAGGHTRAGIAVMSPSICSLVLCACFSVREPASPRTHGRSQANRHMDMLKAAIPDFNAKLTEYKALQATIAESECALARHPCQCLCVVVISTDSRPH